MQRLIGLILTAGGALLGWQAWQQHQSLAGQISSMVGGAPSNQTLLMAGTAAVALLAGIYLVLRGR